MEKQSFVERLWRKVRGNLSFFAVLAATFLALALIVGLTFGSFYKTSREDAVTIGNMTVSQEARRIEDALSSGINTLLVSGYTVDRMLADGDTPEAVEAYMVHETNGIISGIDPEFSGIYGVIQDEYVDGIGWQPEPGYDPYSRPWYLAAAEKQGELAIVSPYVDAQTGNVLVSFSKLLDDGKSAISLDIRLDNIYQVTETVQLNGEGYCFLVDDRGQVIAHRDHSFVGRNLLEDPTLDGTDLRKLMEQINTGEAAQTLDDVQMDGEDCMVFSHNVRGAWNVILIVRSSALFRELRQSLMRNIFVSLAIFILLGYFCTSNYRNKKRALRYAQDVRTDNLTGLNNRGEFERYLNAVTGNQSTEKSLYLLILDADDFKRINDRFGHPEGDRALRLIAQTLRNECHGTDWFCARYGGDEFVILCRCGSEAEVAEIIADIDRRLRVLTEEQQLPYALTVSCGFARYLPQEQTLADLVASADRALYQEKAEKKRR